MIIKVDAIGMCLSGEPKNNSINFINTHWSTMYELSCEGIKGNILSGTKYPQPLEFDCIYF